MVDKKQDSDTSQPPSNRVMLGEWEVDLAAGYLLKGNVKHKLEPILAALLATLVSAAGQVVSRDKLLEKVWMNRTVSDDAIRAAVKKLRERLNDDAKDPKYIKTVPLQGYLLVAKISAVPTSTQTKMFTHRSPIDKWVLTSALLLFIIVSVLGFVITPSPAESVGTFSSHVQPLTNMPGSELLANYQPEHQALLFSHRFNNEEPLSLYIKHLENGRIQRLTWDEANYHQALWSPVDKRFIVTRVDGSVMSHLIAHFDSDNQLIVDENTNLSAIANKTLLGWSANGENLYVKDILAPGRPMGISKFAIESGQLTRITSPNVEGVGDFFAKESTDGKLLGVLRAINKDRIEMMLLDLATGAIVVNRVLNFKANQFVWSANSDSIVMSGFMGALNRYSLGSDRFEAIVLDTPNTNDVIYMCDELCFYMRQHNGNFLDIQEQPNPFIQNSVLETEHFNLSGAEDFPAYSGDGKSRYFASLDQGKLTLVRHDNSNGAHRLYQFDKDLTLSSLSVNKQQTFILGQLDKRIFVFDIVQRELIYLTTEFESVSNPSWSSDGLEVFMVKQEKEQNIVYKYHLASAQQEVYLTDYLAFRQSSDDRNFAVNKDRKLVLLEPNQAPQFLTQLGDANINYWRVKEPFVYVMKRNGNTGVDMLRINANSGETEIQTIAKHRFRLNFDIHPTQPKMMVVRSLLADSNIVKVVLARSD